jgi:hypothetical protein
MTATGIGAAVFAAIFLFLSLRDLLLHPWQDFRAIRLVFCFSVLALMVAALIFLAASDPLPALGYLAVAFVATEVGERAILQVIRDEEPASVSGDTIGTVVLKAFATVGAFVLAVSELFG